MEYIENFHFWTQYLKTPLPNLSYTILKNSDLGLDSENRAYIDDVEYEKTIFGAAISIKHPILQKAWINCGYNQLNDTEISITGLLENI